MKIGQKIWYWNGREIQKIEIKTIHKTIHQDGERIDKVNDKRIDVNFVFSTKKALKEYLVEKEESKKSQQIEYLKTL